MHGCTTNPTKLNLVDKRYAEHAGTLFRAKQMLFFARNYINRRENGEAAEQRAIGNSRNDLEWLVNMMPTHGARQLQPAWVLYFFVVGVCDQKNCGKQ